MKRIALRALLALLGLAIAVVLGIIVVAEWNYRAAVRQPQVPASVRFDATGDAGRPVLILLHGAGLNGHMWDAVRRHLDPALRVIALDLPGHGSRRDAAYSLEGAAATVAAAAQAVAPAPVILAGDSLGGYSALAAAAALPAAQLRGVVLAGSSSNFDAKGWSGYFIDLVKITLVAAFVDNADFATRALALFGVAESDRPAIVAAGVNLPAVPQAGRALIGVDMRAKLAAIDAPVLIVNGALDARAVTQEASFVAVARHPAQYRFDNTGHGVSMRRPAEFAALLNTFAARAFAAPTP
jgi:pimeloyl-ACP methyl ester carboxylesterase